MSEQIKVVVIEDEMPAARLLSSMLKELRPEWNVQILSGSVEDSVEWFAVNPHPDLIFLDIQLSDGISFSFLERAKPASQIIFTTAYDEYAVRAFSVNSVDYLLKPVDRRRLLEAIERFEKNRALTRVNLLEADLTELLQLFRNRSEKKFRTRFLIAGANRFYTLLVSDVAYFVSRNKVTFAVERNRTEHVIDLSLDRLSEQLDPDVFFRANGQFLISVGCVKRIEPFFLSKVVLHIHPKPAEEVYVSREKVGSLKLWLNY